MDPLNSVSSISSIIGLILNFKSEQRSMSEDEFKEFMSWLDSKRHKRLIEEINSNHQLGQGIKMLLNENHELVMEKLTTLDKSITLLASKISGLKEISYAISPNLDLSEQAISIIKQLDKSNGSYFQELKILGGTGYITDSNTSIEINEPRFVDDDLAQLCNLEFLRPDRSRNGDRMFRLTRSASEYVRLINEDEL